MSDHGESEPVNILLVEDNPGDVRLTKEAFKDGKICNTIHVATDGVEALDFCYQRGEFADAPRPDLVLLDFNLPRTDGDEVLAEIKDDPELKCIPVIVLTTSDSHGRTWSNRTVSTRTRTSPSQLTQTSSSTLSSPLITFGSHSSDCQTAKTKFVSDNQLM